MCVPFNEMTREPEELLGKPIDLGLNGGSAVSQIQVGPSGWGVKVADQSNAFSFVRTPERWWIYHAGPRVRAVELPAEWVRECVGAVRKDA